MATTTRVVANRMFDHVYDPVYTQSGVTDQGGGQGRGGPTVVHQVPASGNMFSDLDNYPSHKYRAQAEAGAPRTGAGGGAAAAPAARGTSLDMMVTGHDRYKYFRRPIVPFMQTMPPQVVLAQSTEPERNPLMPPKEPERTGPRTVGVQTQYRESEAQTDPYTPDYVLPQGDEPELLTLATLHAHRGLPAGMNEIAMIERARQKRAFEASLPPMTDEASFELRKRLMEEQETREWRAREDEIDRLQAERLRMLREALQDRDNENEFLAEERVEMARQQHMHKKERAVAGIQRRRVQALRKMKQRQQQAEAGMRSTAGARPRGGVRRDIISEYADPTSKVYAPETKLGLHPDRNADRFEVQPQDLRTLGGLAELEHVLPQSATALRVKRPPRRKPARSAAARAEERVAGEVARQAERMEIEKAGATEEPRELPEWRKTPERVHRPRTPRVAAPADDEEAELSLVLLQRLMRGRAVQNMMFEGKEKRMALIRELRASEPLEAEAEELERTDAAAAVARAAEEAAEATVDAVHGEVVAHTLEYLSKELVRMREQRKVLGMVRRAERERRTREAEEAGRRQAEQMLRRRNDEMYKQILGVHQRTVDALLGGVTREVVTTAARQQALDEIQVEDGGVEAVVDMLEAEQGADDAVVKDLVTSLLFPEMERQRLQREVELRERRHVQAAHQAIYAAATDASQRSGEKGDDGSDRSMRGGESKAAEGK